MKKMLPSGALLLLLVALGSQPFAAQAQNTEFTYQGQVLDNSAPFTGPGLFEFALVTSTNISSPAAGTANMGGSSPHEFVSSFNLVAAGNGYSIAPAVTITGGGGSGASATTTIANGAVTSINIINPGSGYTSTPTVTIAPPPADIIYTTYWSNDGTSSAGSEPAAAVSAAVTNGLFTVVLGDTTQSNMTAIPAAIFSGQANLQLRIWFNDGVNGFAALSPLQTLTSTPYAIQSLNANSASNLLGSVSAAQLTGTIANTLLAGFQGNNNAIGGGVGNSISGTDSAILGGLDNTNNANQSVLGGGGGNLIQSGAYYAFIGSGGGNVIQGNAYDSAIGGGYHNTIQTNAIVSFIGGGQYNTAQSNATFSVIGGGLDNTNTGPYATIPGGEYNVAGSNSFAAGSYAQATNAGSFVWSDASSTTPFNSTNNYSFNIRATGGVRLVTSGKGLALDGLPVFSGFNGSTLTNLSASQLAGGTVPLARLPVAVVTNFENGVTLTNLLAAGTLSFPQYDYYAATPLDIVAGTNLLLATGAQGSFYFGPNAGNTNNYAQQNTGFGTYALNAITSGYNNVAVGFGCLQFITTGGANTAVGLDALGWIKTANDNTACGFAALGENLTGSNNVAVGSDALAYLGSATSGGSGNIALGYNAGSAYNNNESGNILIGHAGVAGENNVIRIGTPGIQTATYLTGTTTISNASVSSFNVLGNRTGGWGTPVAQFQNLSSAAGGSPALRLVGGTGNAPDGVLSVSSATPVGTANSLIAEFGNASSFVLVVSNEGSLFASGTIYSKGVALTSDRNAKANFTPLDSQTILAKVAGLPVTEWNYKSDGADQKHIGPMAQDFHAAFGLDGADDTHISVVDEGGVALAAIQGLNQKLEAAKAENAELKARLEKLERLMTDKLGAAEMKNPTLEIISGGNWSLVSVRLRLLLAFILLPASFCLRVSGQSYTIDWYKIAGGGGTSTGGTYQVSGTIGQPDASGPMTGGNYSMTGGYWAMIQVIQEPGVPRLLIVPNGPNGVKLLWPDPATNTYTLQQNTNLATATWTTSIYPITPANGTNSVTITQTTGNLFFRLANP